MSKKIGLPLRVDAERLYGELCRRYPARLAMHHCNNLFLGDNLDLFKALARLGDRDCFSRWYLEMFSQYQEPSKLGAIGLFIDWLNSTRDLESLVELACTHPEGPGFDPAAFTSALLSTWVTVDPKRTSFLEPFRLSPGETDTVYSQFGMALLDIYGYKGRTIQYHMSAPHLLEILLARFPAYAKSIQEAFDTATRRIERNLTESRSFFERNIQDADREVSDQDRWEHIQVRNLDQLSKVRQLKLKGLAYGLRMSASKDRARFPELFEATETELKEKIVRLCEARDLVWTEDAWGWIDREEDRQLLELLLVLTLIDGHEKEFSEMRRGLFERRELCCLLRDLRDDTAGLAEIEELIEIMKQYHSENGHGPEYERDMRLPDQD